MVSLDRAAHVRLERMLARLVETTNAGLEEAGVLLRVAPSVVNSDDGLQAPGLDLIFEPESADERRYWELLEPAYQRCLAHLDEVHDADGGGDRPASAEPQATTKGDIGDHSCAKRAPVHS
jgi:hypothetical protein